MFYLASFDYGFMVNWYVRDSAALAPESINSHRLRSNSTPPFRVSSPLFFIPNLSTCQIPKRKLEKCKAQNFHVSMLLMNMLGNRQSFNGC